MKKDSYKLHKIERHKDVFRRTKYVFKERRKIKKKGSEKIPICKYFSFLASSKQQIKQHF